MRKPLLADEVFVSDDGTEHKAKMPYQAIGETEWSCSGCGEFSLWPCPQIMYTSERVALSYLFDLLDEAGVIDDEDSPGSLRIESAVVQLMVMSRKETEARMRKELNGG